MKRLLITALAVYAAAAVGCRHHNLADTGCNGCGGLAGKPAVQTPSDNVQLATHTDGVHHAGHEGVLGPAVNSAFGAPVGAGCAGCASGCGGNHAGHGHLGGHGHNGQGPVRNALGHFRNPQAVHVPRMHAYPMPTGPSGPPTAHVGYPYYTTRGPRDFLIDDPPPLGY